MANVRFSDNFWNYYLLSPKGVFSTVCGEPTKRNHKVRVIEEPVYLRDKRHQIVFKNNEPVFKLNHSGHPQSRFNIYLAIQTPAGMPTAYIWASTVCSKESNFAKFYRSLRYKNTQVRAYLKFAGYYYKDGSPAINIDHLTTIKKGYGSNYATRGHFATCNY